jgi:hypothetical protein
VRTCSHKRKDMVRQAIQHNQRKILETNRILDEVDRLLYAGLISSSRLFCLSPSETTSNAERHFLSASQVGADERVLPQ